MASNSYFQYFDTLVYDQDGVMQEVVNIVRSVQPANINISNFYIFQKYQVSSGEIPESISYKLYNTTDYFWTILVINNIVNPFTDWPMSDSQVEALTTKKYGAGNEYEINRWVWTGKDGIHPSGMILDQAQVASISGYSPNYMAYTNLSWEIECNTKKKAIIVINPNSIQSFVEAYRNALKGKS